MTHHTFTTPHPIRLDLDNGSGRVTVRATETGETTVEVSGRHADEVVVSHDGDTVSVTGIRAKIPTSLNIGVATIITSDGKRIYGTGGGAGNSGEGAQNNYIQT